MEQCPACGSAVEAADGRCASCGLAIEGSTATLDAVTEPLPPVYGETVAIDDSPVLVVRKGVEVGERFHLDRRSLTIGRDPSSDIFLNDVTVSRKHARLDVDASGVTVTDAGSLNGTIVNEQVVDSAELRSGDAVQIGRFQMVFLSGRDR